MTKHELGPGRGVKGAAVVRGLILSMLVLVVFGLILGILFYLTPLDVQLMQKLAKPVLVLIAAVGGMSATARAGGRGLWHGLAVGVLFGLLLLLLGAIGFNQPMLSAGFTTMLGLAVLGGIIGGITAAVIN